MTLQVGVELMIMGKQGLLWLRGVCPVTWVLTLSLLFYLRATGGCHKEKSPLWDRCGYLKMFPKNKAQKRLEMGNLELKIASRWPWKDMTLMPVN